MDLLLLLLELAEVLWDFVCNSLKNIIKVFDIAIAHIVGNFDYIFIGCAQQAASFLNA